jgi:hypothetical protein
MATPIVNRNLQSIDVSIKVEDEIDYYVCKIDIYPTEVEIWCRDIQIFKREKNTN